MLGGAASSRLVQEVREQRGMAYSVYSYVASYDDTGQIGIYVGTRAENVAECVEIARAQMADFAAGGLTADELERAKESVKGRMLLALESTSSRMSRLGRAVLSGSEILSLDEVAARVDAVSHEDVTAIAAELFAPERFSIAGIGPDHDRFSHRRGRRGRAARGGRVTRVIVAGASGRTGAPVDRRHRGRRKISTSSARVAPSLAGAGPGLLRIAWPRRSPRCRQTCSSTSRGPSSARSTRWPRSASGMAVVLGTTGLDAEARERLDAAAHAAELPAFYAPNFSLGAVLAMQFAEQAAALFPHVEIVELHSAPQARRALGHRGGHRRAHPRRDRARRADPLGAAAGPRRPPGDAARRQRVSCSRSATTRPRARPSCRACCSRCAA